MFDFVNYFGNVFAPGNFLALCAGTAGGLILGALPGLSPTMAVALLIPFTFHMEPVTGLILLGAVYTATVAGGAVSAILLNIPGAPANIATVLDGHTMAMRGRAAEALQLSFLSSGIGGLLGVFVLIFFTPLLARWALSFGPSHLFWMAILGVTVIASLSSGSVIKGLAAGCLGLWISTIGYDGVLGVERFNFTYHLDGGIKYHQRAGRIVRHTASYRYAGARRADARRVKNVAAFDRRRIRQGVAPSARVGSWLRRRGGRRIDSRRGRTNRRAYRL